MNTEWQLNCIDRQLLNLAFNEDLGSPYCDITTQTLFPQKNTRVATAKIISKHKEPIVVCGLPMVSAALTQLTNQYTLNPFTKDGDYLEPGATLLSIETQEHVLVMAERIMLNFLQRLSAVATLTAKFVAQTQGTQLKILDTRKTTPGFRHLEKYAVQCGGGINHRLGLYDALMIKDTHIDLLGGMANTLAKIPADITTLYPVIIEVRTETELDIILQQGLNKITRILLDNMSLEQMSACAKRCQGLIPTEASGNINLQTIRAVAQSGVDFASVGQLTHSANCVDLSMKCD